MSWLYELYKTYENNFGKGVEVSHHYRKPLLPPYHSLQNAHVEIRIDHNGNFLDANPILNKNEQEIIIPCTEKSASRTSGEEPFPLCDKIQYCAKDYRGKKKHYFNSYFNLLKSWHETDPDNKFLTAIFNYVEKGTLCEDLEKTGKEFTKKDQDLGDLFIRWIVEIPGEMETRSWKRTDLYDSWIKFCEKQENIEDICFITGKKQPIAINHPKRIRNSGDGAKLISANDKSEFTFLGRFELNKLGKEELSNQAAVVSREVSQKAHSALRWLIDRQGFKNGDQVIVSWASSGQSVPDIFADSFSLFEESTEEKLNALNIETYYDAGQLFAQKLNKKIAGYRAELSNVDKIMVMGLDSASPGRMAITYYRELKGSDFLERIETWHKQMAWYFHEFIDDTNNKKKKHSGYLVYAPSPILIAKACYGNRLDDKLKKATVERLLPCIIDGRQIPYDMVSTAVKKASNRVGMEHWDWERTLSVACALYSCYILRNDNQNNNLKKEKLMALDYERTDRDYLYGRLLAIAEHLEEIALNVANESRETTAARLMQRFADFPFSTWRTIESALVPYKSRLSVNRPGFLYNMKSLLDEIHSKFQPDDFENDNRLSGAYLLGYHCQRLELKQKNLNENK
ncbi:MAG: CRISPR-associated protein Csd1 [Epulopiscium sp.]|jgi:CRISPR-associated protein Csd1|nr:CRISPR-associated protein Csd1 [Eubacteriaceae bacterium]MDK2788572.1 CRISPR-associated protein Csd1 [Candidatus Epulonipiscium sp.]